MQTFRLLAGRIAVALSLLLLTVPAVYGQSKKTTQSRGNSQQEVAPIQQKENSKQESEAKSQNKDAHKNSSQQKGNAQQNVSAKQQKSTQQRGKASYYSRRIDGHRTSSGERLNNDSLVCAHRTYPFGSKLLVRNPANGKEVVVRVIDRGPFVRGRVVDLSYEAARRLGMLSAGIALVEVSLYDDTAIPYKPKEYKLPELELELNDDGDSMTPVWQRKEKPETKDNATEEAKHEANGIASDNQKTNLYKGQQQEITQKNTTSAVKKKRSTVRRKTSVKRRGTAKKTTKRKR